MSLGEARFFTGVCRKGELVGSYTGAFWRNNAGQRHGKLFLYLGTKQSLDWMKAQTEKILRKYEALMESQGHYPVNNPLN